MHRVPLLSALDEYEQLSRKHFAHFTDEEERLQKVRAFVNTHTNCFDREKSAGASYRFGFYPFSRSAKGAFDISC